MTILVECESKEELKRYVGKKIPYIEEYPSCPEFRYRGRIIVKSISGGLKATVVMRGGRLLKVL
tara:strand:- start:467 stop:658 length:192 start_codon:yes stop_codon:yes gene_type:complete